LQSPASEHIRWAILDSTTSLKKDLGRSLTTAGSLWSFSEHPFLEGFSQVATPSTSECVIIRPKTILGAVESDVKANKGLPLPTPR